MFTMAATAVSGLWKAPKGRFPWSSSKLGEEGKLQSSGEAESNHQPSCGVWGRIPRLMGRGKRGKKEGSGLWDEEENWRWLDPELDFVIVPWDVPEPDYEVCDYSVGWLEPHAPSFTDDENEEKFQVLVPSYRSAACRIGPANGSHGRHETSTVSSCPPPWESLLSNLTEYSHSDVQKQVDLWLQSLSSPI